MTDMKASNLMNGLQKMNWDFCRWTHQQVTTEYILSYDENKGDSKVEFNAGVVVINGDSLPVYSEPRYYKSLKGARAAIARRINK